MPMLLLSTCCAGPKPAEKWVVAIKEPSSHGPKLQAEGTWGLRDISKVCVNSILISALAVAVTVVEMLPCRRKVISSHTLFCETVTQRLRMPPCFCRLPECQQCMQSLRPGSVIEKLAATAPFRQAQGPGHSISPAAKEVIANVDHSLRQLLADESLICKGPNWSDLPSSSTTAGSRLDHLIAAVCGTTVTSLQSIRRQTHDAIQKQDCCLATRGQVSV